MAPSPVEATLVPPELELADVAVAGPADHGVHGIMPEPDTLWLDHVETDAKAPSVFWLMLTITAIAAWGIWTAWVASGGFASLPSPNDIYAHVGQFLVPASLMLMLWLIGGHVGGRGAARHLRLLAKVRLEQQHLDNRLNAIGQHWLEAHDRLVSRSHGMAEEMLTASSTLDGISTAVDERMRAAVLAAGEVSDHGQAARRHMEGLILALPKVDETARRMADSIKAAGQSAYQYGGQLEERMAQLRVEMTEAESVAQSVNATIGERVDGLHQAVAAVDSAAAQANSRFSSALDQQRDAALSLLVELAASLENHAAQTEDRFARVRTTFDSLASEQLDTLDGRVQSANDAASTLDGRLTASATTLVAIEAAIATAARQAVDRFAAIDAQLAASRTQFAELVEGFDSGSDAIERRLTEAGQHAADYVSQAGDMQEALERIAEMTELRLPAALSVLRQAQLDGQAVVDDLAERLARQVTVANDMNARVDASGQSLERHVGLLQDMHGKAVSLREQHQAEIDTLTQGVEALGATLGSKVAEWTSAVATMRQELLNAADSHGQRLEQAIDGAVARATSPEIDARLAAVGVAATSAVAEADALSARLAQQVAAIEQSSALLEERVATTNSKVEGQSSDTLARLVARTNEALQSTAVDLTRLLAADVSDQAWEAYLKGDRSVFARRAVRLLNTAEARDVLARYQNDDDFRGLVNRYIHDFEGILRNVMDTRDGAALSVTLLSSDIGKVYVALAQAIERLRN